MGRKYGLFFKGTELSGSGFFRQEFRVAFQQSEKEFAMVRRPEIEIRENVRGGKGIIEYHHILTREEMDGHGNDYDRMVLHPLSTLGYHVHTGDKESYYFISGHGVFIEDGGKKRTEVGPGDLGYLNYGEGHGVENLSDTEDLVIIALKLNKPE